MSSKIFLLAAFIAAVLIMSCACFPTEIMGEIQHQPHANVHNGHNQNHKNPTMGARVARQYFGYPYYPGGFYGGGGSMSQAQAQAQASSGSGGTYFG